MEQETTEQGQEKRQPRPMPECPPGEQELFPEIEVTRYYRIPRKTLQGWRLEGKGPPFVKLGARVYYRRQDLNEFILERLRSSTSETGHADA